MNTYNMDKMYESYSSEVERMQKCIDELQQENKKLKDNWNKLEKFLVEKQKQGLSVISADYVLYIMIKIEREESDE